MARFFLLLLLLCPCAARANVIPWNFGSPAPLSARDGRDIVLQSETFRAQIFYDYATASATYRFRNEGAAQTVTMAFAGEQPRDADDVEGASFLRVRVDDKSASFRRERKGEMFETVTRYIGRVRFERGQTRVMQVEIRTQEFWSYLFGADLKYAFAGPQWKGQTRSDIGMEIRAPGTFIVSAYQGESDYFDEKDAVAFQKTASRCRVASEKELSGAVLFALTPTLVPDWLTEEGADPLDQTVTVPGKAEGLYAAAFWLPPALIKNGVTYIRLDYFTGYGFRENSRFNIARLSWNAKSSTATFRAYGHTLEVTKGRRNARLDGRAFQLQGAPFTAEETGHDIGSNTPIYAPLADVAQALGVGFNVNRGAHRFYVALPKPTKP